MEDDSPNLSLKRIEGNQDVSIEDSRNIFGIGGQNIAHPVLSGSALRRTCNFSDLTSSPIGGNGCEIDSKRLMTGSPQLDIAKAAQLQDIVKKAPPQNILIIKEDTNNNVNAAKAKKNGKKATKPKTKKLLCKVEDNKNFLVASELVSESRLTKTSEKTSTKTAKQIFSTKTFAKIIDQVIKSDVGKLMESQNRKHGSKSRKKSKVKKEGKKGQKKESSKKRKDPEYKDEDTKLPGILQLDRNNNNAAIEELLKEAAGILGGKFSTESIKPQRKAKSKKSNRPKRVVKENLSSTKINTGKKSKSKSKEKKPKSTGIKNKDYSVNVVEIRGETVDPVLIKAVKLVNSDKCGGDTVKNILIKLPRKTVSWKKGQTRLACSEADVDVDYRNNKQNKPSLQTEKSEKLLSDVKNKSIADLGPGKVCQSCTTVKESSRMKKSKLDNNLQSKESKVSVIKKATSQRKNKVISSSIGDDSKSTIKLNTRLSSDKNLQASKSANNANSSRITAADTNSSISTKTIKKKKTVLRQESTFFNSDSTPETPPTAIKIMKNQRVLPLTKVKKDKSVANNPSVDNIIIIGDTDACSKRIKKTKVKFSESSKSIKTNNSRTDPLDIILCSPESEPATSSQTVTCECDHTSNTEETEIIPEDLQDCHRKCNQLSNAEETEIIPEDPQNCKIKCDQSSNSEETEIIPEDPQNSKIKCDQSSNAEETEIIPENPQNSQRSFSENENVPEIPITVRFPELIEFKGPREIEYNVFSVNSIEENSDDFGTGGEDDDDDSDDSGSIALKRKKREANIKKFIEDKKPDLKGVINIGNDEEEEEEEEIFEEYEEEEEEEEEYVEEESKKVIKKRTKKPKKKKPKKKQPKPKPKPSVVDNKDENNNAENETNPWWGQMYQNPWGQNPWGQMDQSAQNNWDETDQSAQNNWDQTGTNFLEQMMAGIFAQNGMGANSYPQYPEVNQQYGQYPNPNDPYQQNYNGYYPYPCPPPPQQNDSISSCDEVSSCSCSCSSSECTISCSCTNSSCTSFSSQECEKSNVEESDPCGCEVPVDKHQLGLKKIESDGNFLPCIKTNQAGGITFTLPSKIQHKTTIRVAQFPQPATDTTYITGVPESELPQLTKKNARPNGYVPGNFPMPTPTNNCYSFNPQMPQNNVQVINSDPMYQNIQMQSNLLSEMQMENNMMPGMQMQGNMMPGMQMQGNMMPDMQMQGNAMSDMQMQGNMIPGMQMQNNQMPTIQSNFITDLQMINALLSNQSPTNTTTNCTTGANRPYQTLFLGPNRTKMVDQNGDTVLYDF